VQLLIEPVVGHAELGQRLSGNGWLGEQGQQVMLGADPTVIEPTRLVGRTS
jgi:hypothetical protein